DSVIAGCKYGVGVLSAGFNATQNRVVNSNVSGNAIGVFGGSSNPAISVFNVEMDNNGLNFLAGPSSTLEVRHAESQGSTRMYGNGAFDGTDPQNLVFDDFTVQGFGAAFRTASFTAGSFTATGSTQSSLSGTLAITIPQGITS